MTREEARDKLIDHRARLDMVIKMTYGEEAEVSESFDIAIQALEQIQQIKDIINAPVYIQEDVMRYKAICEVIKDGEEE